MELTKPNTGKWILFPLVVFLLFFSGRPAYAQYLTGASISSYSGVNSQIINPAFMANSRYYLDVNVFGMGSFFQNNYAYLAQEEYSFFSFLDPNYSYPMHNKEYGEGERPAYTVENYKLKSLLFDNRVLGPSAMLAFNDHTFSLQTSFRSVSSFRNIPYDMANYFYYSLDYAPQHGIEYDHRDPMRSGSVSWSEIGLSWSYIFAKYDRAHWAFGVSAKVLLGQAAYYVYLDQLKYFVPDDDNLYVRNVEGVAAYSFPVDYDNNELYNGDVVKGMGLGFDFGLSYIHTKGGHRQTNYKRPCQQTFQEYKYRIGVSLMDFGSINFTDVARRYTLDNYSGTWHQIDTLGPYYNNLNFISSDINSHLCGSGDCAQTGNSFRIVLPTSLGAQFDYNVYKNVFVSSTLKIPLNYSKNQVSTAYGLMVAPRVESEEFEFGIPFTLYDMKRPLLGAYLRFYNVTVGTDNLSGFLNLTDHYGYNLYFTVKFNFLRGKCKRKMQRFCTGDEYRYWTPFRKK